MRVLIVEDEPYMAEAIRDGLRLEAIAADIAGDGRSALELLSINAYDVAVLDRDIPRPTGDEIAERIVASGSGMPILMLTAADRLGVDIRDSLVLGDSIWDMIAAQRARGLGVGLLSGGYGEEELARAGAFRVYEDPADLLKHIDEVAGRS